MTDLTLLPATERHVKEYWRINNDPSVRAVSFSAESIPWETHLAWYERSLESSQRKLYVTVELERVVAVSRMDILEESAEISLAVEPSCHGRGIGVWTIQQTGSAFKEAHPSIKKVRALVKAENIPSRRTFEKAGYTLSDTAESVEGETVLAYWLPLREEA